MRAHRLSYIAAGLFLVAGLRDLFFPGMLQISSHRSGSAGIAMNFALGLFFCAPGIYRRFRRAAR